MELRECDIPNPLLWARAGIFAPWVQEGNSCCVPSTGLGLGLGIGPGARTTRCQAHWDNP